MKSANWIFIGVFIAGIAIMGKKKYTELRGLRLNNPGNLRISNANDWLGKVSPSMDPEFEQFESPEYGIRAMGKTLLTYFEVHQIDTILGIINRYAPASENDSRGYAVAVADRLGVTVESAIYVPGQLDELVKAMIHQEQGKQPYSDTFISDSLMLEA